VRLAALTSDGRLERTTWPTVMGGILLWMGP